MDGTHPRPTSRRSGPCTHCAAGCRPHRAHDQQPGREHHAGRLPPRVTLTFSDKMAEKYAKVAVTGPDGKPAAAGKPQVDGRNVTLPFVADGPAGRYTVGYRVVSADGHPISGS
ncbi:copper resistance protein CopC [Streptomyces sp. NPDC001046]|uniref:copper resistance CopC family protein n=1 Tax=Streptomyces sp. NPDC001046 TaxID=3364543 RepID=UPI0036CA9498